MALPFRRPPSRDPVGLDLDGAFLAAVRLEDGRIAQAASADLEPGLIRDGEVVDEVALSDALKRFAKAAGLPPTVRLGVANQQIVVRQLELPEIEAGEERDAAVRFLAAEAIAMPLEEVVLDYQVIGRTVSPEGAARLRVVVVAARAAMIDCLVSAVRGAGLRPEGIDLSAFALVRTLGRSGEEEDERARVLCHLGGVTNLAVAVGRTCLFTRLLSVSVGAGTGPAPAPAPDAGATAASEAGDAAGPPGAPAGGEGAHDPATAGGAPGLEPAPAEPRAAPPFEAEPAPAEPAAAAPFEPESGPADPATASSFEPQPPPADPGAGIPEPADPDDPPAREPVPTPTQPGAPSVEPVPAPGDGASFAPSPGPEAVPEGSGSGLGAEPDADGIKDVAAALAEEIRLSIDYYMGQPDARWVGEVVLSGPGSTHAGLADEVAAAIGMPVSVAEPLGGLDASGLPVGEDPHRHTVAAGLALGGEA